MITRIGPILLRIIFCAVFLVAGVGKLDVPGRFAEEIHALGGLSEGMAMTLALIIPGLEIALALRWVTTRTPSDTAWISLLLLVAFSLVTAIRLGSGDTSPCVCFGPDLAMAPGHALIRNLLLALLLIPALRAGPQPTYLPNRRKPRR